MSELTNPGVLHAFSSQGVEMGKELFFPLKVAIEIVRQCSNSDIAVLGLEGFSYQDGKVTPRLDRTIDFADWAPAGHADRLEGNEQVVEILREWMSEQDLVFVFLLEEKDDDGPADVSKPRE